MDAAQARRARSILRAQQYHIVDGNIADNQDGIISLHLCGD